MSTTNDPGWTKSIIAGIIFFFVASVFLVMSPFILLFATTAGLCASIISIFQILVSTTPRSAAGHSGVSISRLAGGIRQVAQMVLSIWILLTNFLFAWPAFIIYLNIAVVYTAIQASINLFFSVANKVFGGSYDTRNSHPLRRFLVFAGLIISCRLSNVAKAVRNRLTLPLKIFPDFRAWSLFQKQLTWVANTSLADDIAEQSAVIGSWLENAIASTLSLLYLLVSGTFLDSPDPDAGYFMVILAALVVAQTLMIVLTSLILPFKPFMEVLDDIKREIALKAVVSNTSLYEPIPLTDEPHSPFIRLLTINPGSRGQPIICTLSSIELHGEGGIPVYEALSYVWGSAAFNLDITVNGKPFHLSKSLFQALNHLRYESGPRTMWVDALCIDQSNIPERNSQVLLMPRIYSTASRVVVWLGESEPLGLDHAIDITKSQAGENLKSEIQTNHMHYGTTHAVASLLRRKYWTRVWVVQELVLAQHVEVYCGRSSVDWEHFCVLVEASARRSFFPERYVYLPEFRALVSLRKARRPNITGNTQRIQEARPKTTSGSAIEYHETDLVSIWYKFHNRKATDNRDKIFAFLGLLEDSNSLLKPDYARRDTLLSVDLANQHIRRSRTLSVVCFVESARLKSPQSPGNQSDMYIPSWCPAFMSDDLQSNPPLQLFWTGLPGQENHFAATNDLPILVVPEESSIQTSEYAVSPAYHYLKIHVLSSFRVDISNDGRREGALEELVSATKSKLRSQGIPPEWRSMAEQAVVSRAKVCGTYSISSPDLKISADELYHRTLTAGRFSVEPPKAEPEYQQYSEARREACSGRRLFITANGYLGLGPENLRSGDQLHLALGMGVPLILRDTPDDWNKSLFRDGNDYEVYRSPWLYVGQAYVHELMVYNGDLAADIKSGKVSLEEMILT